MTKFQAFLSKRLRKFILPKFLSQKFLQYRSTLKSLNRSVFNNPLVLKAKQWHTNLQPREQWLVSFTGIILSAYLGYLVILSPIIYLFHTIDQAFNSKQADLLWLQEQAKLARVYQNNGLANLNEQQLVNSSRSIFQQKGIEVKVNSTRQDKDFIVSLEYAGDNASGFFSGLSQIVNLGVLLRSLEFNRIQDKQVSIKADLVY